MKPNELMIGDWVWSEYPGQIEGMDKRYDVIRLLGNIQWYDTKYHEPIHISQAILKANGFVEKETGKGRFAWTDGETIDIEMWKTCGPKWSLEILTKDRMQGITLLIQFVHELQHAVRLMGQHDLANNFVIKEGGKS